MLGAIGQYVGGKVLTALLVVGSAGGIIYFWNHPEQLEAVWAVMKGVLAWIAFVMVLPWATFFVQRWVVDKDSNMVAAFVLAAYVVLDAMVALLLAGVSGHGFLAWTILLIGFLSAGVYNFIVCDYQVTRFEEG